MVSAPKSRSEVAKDQALYDDMWAKTSRQLPVDKVKTLLVIALENKPKYRRLTRITQCMVSLTVLADACDAAARLDIPTPSRSNTDKTKNQQITTGASEAHATRRSARIAAKAGKRQQQASSSSPADVPHQAVAPSFVTQSDVPRKRKRSTKATASNTKEEIKAASHARVGGAKRVKLAACSPLGTRNV